jgi:peptidyl-prolyl cis-trans isomerase SurA
MKQQVLDKLIDEKLQLQEAKGLGISVGEDQVTAGFADIARQNSMSPDDFRKRLSANGVKVSSLYDQIRAEIAWSQVVQRKLRPEINVSESEIDNIFDQIAQIDGKTEYLVSEIFLPVNDASEESAVQSQAEKIVKKITKGASFGAVARESSQGPGAAKGGEIGWVQEGQIDAPLEAALAKMQPGQLSPPVRTAKGWHVLFLKDRRRNKIAAPKQQPATSTIISLKQILIPVSEKDPDNIVAAKIARAQSLKDDISSCAEMEAASNDFPSPGTGDLGQGPLENLPEALKVVVENLDIGELSAPLRNEDGIAVLMVCSQEEQKNGEETIGGTASLPKISPAIDKNDEGARNKVAAKIGMQRLDRLQEHYLQDLRATAFIEKRI